MAVAQGAAATADGDGLMAGLVEALRRAGDSPGTAFPSSHCAGVTAAALFARRCFAPATCRWLAVWAALVVLSTVYTRNHYALDATAGVLTALSVHGLVVLAESRRTGAVRRPARGRQLLHSEGGWS
jgi:membrane-associated phospholipid phosphatase